MAQEEIEGAIEPALLSPEAELYTADRRKTAAWYQEVLGFRIGPFRDSGRGSVMMYFGQMVVHLWDGSPSEIKGEQGRKIQIAVDNAAKLLIDCVTKHARVLQVGGGEKVAFFEIEDCDGRIVRVNQRN